MAYWNDSAIWGKLSSRVSAWVGFLQSHLWKILTGLVILGLALTRTASIPEADTFWQIRSGLDLWESWNFRVPDDYSWTATGQEYISNSWLWNVLLAGVYSTAGTMGIAVFTGLCSAVLLTLIALMLRTTGVKWEHIFLSTSFSAVFLAEWLTARPQMVDYLLLAAGMLLISSAVKKGKSRVHLFVILGLILLVWQNFHLTGPVGSLCFAGFYFMMLMKEDGLTTVKVFASKMGAGLLMLVFLLVVCLATPYGADGLVKPFVTASASKGLIAEWVSPWGFTEPSNNGSAVGLALILLMVAVLVWRKEYLPALFISGLVLIASDQARWVPFAVILSAVYLCSLLASLPPSKRKLRPYLKAVALGVVVAFAGAGSLTFMVGERASGHYGYTLVESIPSECRLYNEQAFGGPVTLLRPDVKVSLDGRNDLYGATEYFHQVKVSAGKDGSLEWLDEENVDCVMVHDDRGLNELLDASHKWEITDEDMNGARLWVRK